MNARRFAKWPAAGNLDLQVLKSGAVSLCIKVGGTLIALVISILLARSLGPSGFGTYAYVFALVSVVALPIQFGLSSLTVRETAKALALEDWSTMGGVWRWTTWVAVAASLGMIASGAGLAWLLEDRFSPDELRTFAWGLLLIPLLAVGNLRAAALQGLQRMVPGLLSELVLRTGFLLVMVIAVLRFGQPELTAAGAMSLHAFAAAMALVVAAWWLHRASPQAMVDRPRLASRSGEWLRSAVPLAFVAGMQVINTKADILILGVFTAPETVGVYQVAVTGANLVILGLGAINIIVAPRIAHLHAQADIGQLQRLVTFSARAVLVVTVPVVLLLVVFGDRIIETLFGVEYVEAYSPLAILCAGQLVNATFGSVGVLLNMTHNERAVAQGVMIAAIANVMLNFVLIPPFGMSGAATATACSLILWNVLLWRAAHRRLGIESLAFGGRMA